MLHWFYNIFQTVFTLLTLSKVWNNYTHAMFSGQLKIVLTKFSSSIGVSQLFGHCSSGVVWKCLFCVRWPSWPQSMKAWLSERLLLSEGLILNVSLRHVYLFTCHLFITKLLTHMVCILMPVAKIMFGFCFHKMSQRLNKQNEIIRWQPLFQSMDQEKYSGCSEVKF